LKAKITIVTSTGVYPYDINGPAIFLYQLFKGLASHFDTKIMYLTTKKIEADHIINPIYKPLSCFKRLMRSQILIFNSPPVGLLFLILLIGWIMRKRILFIVHGGIFIEPRNVYQTLWRVVLVKTIKMTKMIIVTPSHSMAKILKEFFGVRSMVIHNGVDLKYIEGIPPYKLATNKNIVFVGHLEAIKGVHVLIKAAETLHEIGFSCNLYVIGAGKLEKLLKKYIEKRGLSGIIHFLGPLSNRQALSIVKAADVFVLPSYWETFPTALLEAMACGKPVIATNVGGIPEIIKDRHNGMLVPKGDHLALANAILFLFKEPAYAKRLGEEAKRTIEKRFSLDVMLHKYIHLLKVLL